MTALLDAEVHVELSIDAAGRYTFRIFLNGEGTVQPKDGTTAIVTDRKTGVPITAVYSFPSEDRLNWTTPTADPKVRITLNYKRTGGRRAPENPIGDKMERYHTLCWRDVDAVWEVQPDSSFQFLLENVDERTLTASHGKWEANSKIGRPPAKGVYRNVTPDSFEMSHPVLQVLKFERVSPGNGK